ncbi:riboflavin synthase [Patescibacteria group bacterium]|nr:riboflavin synthase [Patescibacteria group bacterium]
MFTGIIEKKGKITRVEKKGAVRTVTFSKPASWKLKNGQSINVSGVCSTVVRSTSTSVVVEYMPETLRVTTVGNIQKGDEVNLERSLQFGDRMDGHLVMGHVEGVARVGEKKREGRSTLLTLKLPAGLARYAISRGSIALDGVSLTVAKRHGPWVTVALVPHTLAHTTLTNLTVGDMVNVETDIMARHRGHARVTAYAAKPLRKNG